MRKLNRRDFLRIAGLGLLTPYVLLHSREAFASSLEDSSTELSEQIFHLSVASGDPSHSGVILWTRISEQAWTSGEPLYFEVAWDELFSKIVAQGYIHGEHISAEHDYTVRVDLDGLLAPGRTYFYRFIYKNEASRTGRCRTLPAPGADIDRVRFGVLTCQDYTNGFYGAFAHLADEDIDFVLHLGDFIYEGYGKSGTIVLPLYRTFTLPSGRDRAVSLEDYRFLPRTYRSDPFLQRALERHTWINIWDDHEISNDAYWDYEQDTLGAPGHEFEGDVGKLRQLMRDAQSAWYEYVPARVPFNADASHPHDRLQIFRRFSFGKLVDLFMTDERSYRTRQPCGGEYLSDGCPEQETGSMLGESQRNWLCSGLAESKATWKVWGNEVYMGKLTLGQPDPSLADEPQLSELYIVSLDAWDGYNGERRSIMEWVKQNGIQNLVVLTGDLHTYMASYLKVDYDAPQDEEPIGVEFMTPGVTSANFRELILNATPIDTPEEMAFSRLTPDSISEPVVRTHNPHIVFFNSEFWGYSVVEFKRNFCEYTAYRIDKSQNRVDVAKHILRRMRVAANTVQIEDIT